MNFIYNVYTIDKGKPTMQRSLPRKNDCDNVAYASFSSQVNKHSLTKSATAHNISSHKCEYKQAVNVTTFLLLWTDQWEQRIVVWLARRRGPLCVSNNEIYFCLNFVTNVLQFLIALGFFFICGFIVRLFGSFRFDGAEYIYYADC